jgi:glycosyltransferase involved in cell wall biosynthesis
MLRSQNIKSTPLISVIVPIYNKKDYLQRCIKSILKQEYKNFELLLIDDGSTDNSGEICDFYAQKDSRIRVMHQINSGVSKARNTGLAMTKGDYIFFIDPDDYISSKLFKDTIDILHKSNAEIVLFGVQTTNGQNILKTDNLNKISQMPLEKLKIYLSCVGMWEVWRKAYKKCIWNNVQFMDIMRTCEDVYITPEIMKKVNHFAFLHNTYYFWERQPHGSLMQSRTAYTYYEEFIAWKHHIVNDNYQSKNYGRICNFRCLESAVRAISRNKKDHTLNNIDISNLSEFLNENGYSVKRPLSLLMYYFSLMKYIEIDKIMPQGTSEKRKIMKQSIKLYLINNRYDILNDDQKMELNKIIKENSNLNVEIIYKLMLWCIRHNKDKILNISGYLLSKKV